MKWEGKDREMEKNGREKEKKKTEEIEGRRPLTSLPQLLNPNATA